MVKHAFNPSTTQQAYLKAEANLVYIGLLGQCRKTVSKTKQETQNKHSEIRWRLVLFLALAFSDYEMQTRYSLCILISGP